MAQRVRNPTSTREDVDSFPRPAQWVKDLALLWLWHRLEAAAPIQSLVWEILYATDVALKKKKKKGSLLTQRLPVEAREPRACLSVSLSYRNIQTLGPKWDLFLASPPFWGQFICPYCHQTCPGL